MDKIVFAVPGEPQGKARARTVRQRFTGKTMSYTPPNTVKYENWIRTCYMQANGGSFNSMEMLDINILAFFKIPKSVSKVKRELMLSGKIRPTKKPDGDNILKAACDALNGLAYGDDKQLTDKAVHKWYSDEPRLEITLMKL